MKKILSYMIILIIVVSIMASVSDNLQHKIKAISGGNVYSASIVPEPKTLTEQDNLASTQDNSDKKLSN